MRFKRSAVIGSKPHCGFRYPSSRRRLLKMGALIVPLFSIASMGDAAPSSYSLRRVYRNNEIDRYKLTVQILMPGTQNHVVVINANVMDKVCHVHNDGLPGIEETVESLTGTVDGIPASILSAGDASSQFAHGNVPAAPTNPWHSIIRSLTDFERSLSLKRTVRLGEKWQINSSNKSALFSHGVLAFSATEAWQGTKALKLEIAADAAPSEAAAGLVGKFKGSATLSPDSGRTLEITMTGPLMVGNTLAAMHIDLLPLRSRPRPPKLNQAKATRPTPLG